MESGGFFGSDSANVDTEEHYDSVILKCGECGERIILVHASVVYDGELCHLHCAAEAEDEAGFDDWFINK